MDQIKKAAELIRKSKHTTVFTGAGISVESGIPAFRGPGGLWTKYDPKVLELSYFHSNTKESWTLIKEVFYDFFGQGKPNGAHIAIAKLEQMGYVKTVITQNIDNLHQEAGSKKVYEYHGTSKYLVCEKCGARYDVSDVNLNSLPPLCDCGYYLKPDFIFFGEGIPEKAALGSENEARIADVFLVIGTTGEVMPACMIPYKAKENNAKIIEINPETSSFTKYITDIHLKGKAVEIMNALYNEIVGK
ncbi:MAG: RNA polymerase subunit sigma [Bacteroidetes bacterium GWF2_38_335]|nr:MAG: RNA polymerase subunit sigma [Bacteroidetes bacterium GWF2_38_335]OFY80975.1 MAG: RNA polymerase subunit sigma [Bacteroidetes bacterium RIFOXYA12_FULL_38_20]HBS85086.1 RNA polymerase subunit sigma [Bacteroidales bacterium]